MAKKIRYALKPALSEEELAKIVNDGFNILEQLGIECRHSGIQELLVKNPGVQVRQNRIFSLKICAGTTSGE